MPLFGYPGEIPKRPEPPKEFPELARLKELLDKDVSLTPTKDLREALRIIARRLRVL